MKKWLKCGSRTFSPSGQTGIDNSLGQKVGNGKQPIDNRWLGATSECVRSENYDSGSLIAIPIAIAFRVQKFEISITRRSRAISSCCCLGRFWDD